MVDAAIYSEMKGGIHPWFTGLAVVGGVYVFGVVGAVYGPLALCVLYVLVSLYSTFMQVVDFVFSSECVSNNQPFFALSRHMIILEYIATLALHC